MVENVAPTSVGLGGDGDEVDTVREVEKVFGVQLDYDDAPKWVTAGDVFSSLIRSLPPGEGEKPETWARFAKAIVSETGADPSKIGPESPLLSNTRVPWWAVGLLIGAIWGLAQLLHL